MLVVLALGGVLAVLGGASAGTTKNWSRVTDTTQTNIDNVALARTRDGVLHVVWHVSSGSTESLRHVAIQANGTVGPATTAVGGIRGVSNPDLVTWTDGSLRLFYSVVIPSPGGIQMSTAGPSGTGWSGPQKISHDNQGAAPGATTDRNGTPIFAWSPGLNSYYKVGTNTGQADGFLGPAPRCCFYDLETAVDESSGAGFVGYHSNVTDQAGIFVRQILPRVGTPQLAPRVLTGKQFLQPDHRIPLVARQGGGVFLAYCSGYPRCTQVLLWRVGGKVLVVKRGGQDVEDVNLARGPDGRLWVLWQDSARIYASRTNTAATRAGAIVRVPSPPRTSTLWDVFGEGSLGPLDLFAHVAVGGSNSTWHRQVLPGLSLKCVRKKAGATCRVTDAGQSVTGATIKVGRKSVKTLNSGVASFTLRKGSYKVTASKAGYTSATTVVRVR
jgi:hypothetical protein